MALSVLRDSAARVSAPGEKSKTSTEIHLSNRRSLSLRKEVKNSFSRGSGAEVAAVHLLNVNVVDAGKKFFDEVWKRLGFVGCVVKIEHGLDRGMSDPFEELHGLSQAVDHVGLVMPEGLEENFDSAPLSVVGDPGETIGEMVLGFNDGLAGSRAPSFRGPEDHDRPPKIAAEIDQLFDIGPAFSSEFLVGGRHVQSGWGRGQKPMEAGAFDPGSLHGPDHLPPANRSQFLDAFLHEGERGNLDTPVARARNEVTLRLPAHSLHRFIAKGVFEPHRAFRWSLNCRH